MMQQHASMGKTWLYVILSCLFVLIAGCGGGGGGGGIDSTQLPETNNNAPTARDLSFTTTASTIVSEQLIANDIDGDMLTYSLVSNPGKGVVIITDFSTGEFTYTPNEGQHGSDSFTYIANDGTTDSNEATVSITISLAGAIIESKVSAITSENYDLTDLTSPTNNGLDWKFYDDDEADILNPQNTRKNTGLDSMITDATIIGREPDAVKRMNRALDFSFTWDPNDASYPNASDNVTHVNYGTIFRYDATDGSQEESGFSISVDADEEPKMLTLYLGVLNATARLQAAFDDGTQAMSDIYISNPMNDEMAAPANNGMFRMVQIAFHAASATRLTVTYTLFDDDGAASNLSILAATLNKGAVLPPTISPSSGEVTDSTEVTLSTIPEDADIYYTLDDSDSAVAANAQLYTGPFIINTPGKTIVRSIAKRANYITSAESKTSLTVNAPAGGLLSVTVEPAPIDEVVFNSETFGEDFCWAQWGRIDTEQNFKAGCDGVIKYPEFEGLPKITPDQLPRLVTYGFAWDDGSSDGLTVVSDDNQRKSIRYRYVGSEKSQIGNGIRFDVLAADDGSTRIFKLYVGANSGTGRIEASLSDGSAEPAQVLLLENPNGNVSVFYVVTIRYRAAEAGQSLTVKYVLHDDYDNPTVLSLQAATLATE